MPRGNRFMRFRTSARCFVQKAVKIRNEPVFCAWCPGNLFISHGFQCIMPWKPVHIARFRGHDFMHWKSCHLQTLQNAPHLSSISQSLFRKRPKVGDYGVFGLPKPQWVTIVHASPMHLTIVVTEMAQMAFFLVFRTLHANKRGVTLLWVHTPYTWL